VQYPGAQALVEHFIGVPLDGELRLRQEPKVLHQCRVREVNEDAHPLAAFGREDRLQEAAQTEGRKSAFTVGVGEFANRRMGVVHVVHGFLSGQGFGLFENGTGTGQQKKCLLPRGQEARQRPGVSRSAMRGEKIGGQPVFGRDLFFERLCMLVSRPAGTIFGATERWERVRAQPSNNSGGRASRLMPSDPFRPEKDPSRFVLPEHLAGRNDAVGRPVGGRRSSPHPASPKTSPPNGRRASN